VACTFCGVNSTPNNWGQINIISNQRGLRLRGAERFLVLQYEEAPLSLKPL
jgi:hypothetical protein